MLLLLFFLKITRVSFFIYNKTDAFLCQEYICFRIISVNPIAKQNKSFAVTIQYHSLFHAHERGCIYMSILVVQFDILPQLKQGDSFIPLPWVNSAINSECKRQQGLCLSSITYCTGRCPAHSSVTDFHLF